LRASDLSSWTPAERRWFLNGSSSARALDGLADGIVATPLPTRLDLDSTCRPSAGARRHLPQRRPEVAIGNILLALDSRGRPVYPSFP
jgi:hypothetical protein